MDQDDRSLLMLMALAGMRYDLDPDAANGTFFSMAIGVLDLGGGFQIGKVQVRGSLFYTPHVGASFGGDAVSFLGLALSLGYDFAVR